MCLLQTFVAETLIRRDCFQLSFLLIFSLFISLYLFDATHPHHGGFSGASWHFIHISIICRTTDLEVQWRTGETHGLPRSWSSSVCGRNRQWAIILLCIINIKNILLYTQDNSSFLSVRKDVNRVFIMRENHIVVEEVSLLWHLSWSLKSKTR